MSGLVEELQRDALNESVSTSSLLRKMLVVARKLDVNDAAEWLERETRGYSKVEVVPPFRIAEATVVFQNPVYGLCPVLIEGSDRPLLYDHALRQPIAELEHLLNSPKEGRLLIPHRTFQSPSGLNSFPGYLEIQTSSLRRIVDAVRNAVLEWALGLEKRGIVGEGMSFTASERSAAHTVQHINNFYGSVTSSVVQQGTTNAASLAAGDQHALSELLSLIRNNVVAEQPSVAAALAEVDAEIAKPTASRASTGALLQGLANALVSANASAELMGKLIPVIAAWV